MFKDLAETLKKLDLFTTEEKKRIYKLLERMNASSPGQEKKEPAKPREANSTFTVLVEDNYHYMDEDHRYTAGEFDTWEEAVAEARKIVDWTIVPAIESGSTVEEAIEQYLTFGEDPYITGGGAVPVGDFFCAWSYAQARSKELYALKQSTKKTGRTRKIDSPT